MHPAGAHGVVRRPQRRESADSAAHLSAGNAQQVSSEL
jgi:hypothetical protein